MSGARQDRALMADGLHLNGTTALGLQDEAMNTALFEYKVFNIVIIASALCTLTAAGLYCIVACYNRSRKQEATKVNSKIYYIYTNPLPVGAKEEEAEEDRASKARRGLQEQTGPSPPLSFQEYANDPGSGVVLDPPMFYMQL
ncbi:uncharacterized protein [Embiotoca jacksoni]|uniref:uncharacterized protein isoform X2 n=1 Tax=Embiotoca jacksoni TaxID=100190 RepID=UPI003704693E